MTKTAYFVNCKTLDDLKERYKELCKKFHPDISGRDTTAEMQEVNAEYDVMFSLLKNIRRSTKEVGETYTAETTETPEEFREIISKIIHLDIDIEIVGTWVWVTGNTKQCKDELKAAGFRWCNNKKAWSWHSGTYIKKSRKTYGMDDIREMFGSSKVGNIRQPRLAM